MYLGILCVFGACFFWGLIFVVPLAIDGFSPVEVALGRYFFFGLFSLFLFCTHGSKLWSKFSLRLWIAAAGFAAIANVLYYTSLITGLWYSSPAVTTLINGCAPLTIAFFGSIKNGWVNLKHFIYPSIAMGIGLILVNIPAFEEDSFSASTEYFFGLVCAFNALAIWTWFVNANAKFLNKHPEITLSEWTSVMGIATLFWVIVCGAALALFTESEMNPTKFLNYSDELLTYICGTVVLAVACSWVGFYLWNRATTYLSLPLAGQITIFETIFGLIFVHLYEHRIPFFIEFAGIFLMVGGVALASYHSFKQSTAVAVEEEQS